MSSNVDSPFLVVLVLTLAASLSACNERHDRAPLGTPGEKEPSAASRTLTIKGSDTMVILAQKWAEGFMRANPGTIVQVSGGGSGTGIAALINGTTDLANASRPMKDRERAEVQDERGQTVHEVRVALDALAVYIHEDNPVHALSLDELEKIYRAEIRNWKDVGGRDRSIVVYGRENSSGTYAYFKEHVLHDLDFAPSTQTLPGTSAVIHAVSKDAAGIGYGGIAYAEGIRTLALEREDGERVEPTMENATSGRYPLARYLHVYGAGEPVGAAKDYLEFVLSEEGQSIVEDVGYFPLPKKDADPLPKKQGHKQPEGSTPGKNGSE